MSANYQQQYRKLEELLLGLTAQLRQLAPVSAAPAVAFAHAANGTNTSARRRLERQIDSVRRRIAALHEQNFAFAPHLAA